MPEVFNDQNPVAADPTRPGAEGAEAAHAQPGYDVGTGRQRAEIARAIANASDWLHPESRSGRFALQYGLAMLLVAAATGVIFLLELCTDRVTTFPYYVVVVISAWFGIGPGLLAVILSAQVVNYFWVPPIYSLGVDDENLPWFIVFIASSLISLGWAWQRRRAERALEFTVSQRTAELVDANAALRREIAERRAAEAELQEAQAEVARTLRLATVAETAASIAHEINQPLAAIAANAAACRRSLARDPPGLGLAQEAAGCIVNDANRAAEVTARVRALLNKEGPRQVPVDVNRLVRDALTLSRIAIERQAISVRTEFADPLPPVLGDPIQLQQVLLNLVTNGIEAMAATAGRSRVLSIRSEAENREAIVVTVEDSGGDGIAAKQAERIFDSFYTTKPNGIGVGLSISRSIVEAHGGRLWLASADSAGARFCFALPVAPDTAR